MVYLQSKGSNTHHYLEGLMWGGGARGEKLPLKTFSVCLHNDVNACGNSIHAFLNKWVVKVVP